MIISTRCLVRRRCRSQGTNSGSPEGLRATAKSFEISTTGTTASILRRSKDATRNKCIATNKCRASSNKKLLETIHCFYFEGWQVLRSSHNWHNLRPVQSHLDSMEVLLLQFVASEILYICIYTYVEEVLFWE